ncbi:Clp protease N-terminal domain-containing protein [Streptomyces sp. PU-14G]|uniref:Clp protease N-terminal domain-containing protein n=1 Tax=Streptomyces sp. PU-14G TaxID=2800808 RepID=UPI0034E02721
MFVQFTTGARTAVSSAHEEARLRGDRRIGTEHLLLGVLNVPDRTALAAIGIDIEGVERAPIPVSRKRTPSSSGARRLPAPLASVTVRLMTSAVMAAAFVSASWAGPPRRCA